jgi:hypothetical protein
MIAMTHGIQSLLLGGGFGFLTGQHGLVIDNLLQARYHHLSLRQTALCHINNSYVGFCRYREWDGPHS